MKTTTKLLLIAIALGLLSAMSCTPVSAQTTKPDTAKYYFSFKIDNLNYITKKVMHIDSVIVNSNLPAKDAFQVVEFLNSLQDAFLQNYKIQVADMEKKKVKPTGK